MPGTFVPDPLLNPKLSAAWGATVATAVTELQQKAWIAMPFQSPWTNWATSDPSWQVCEYRKVGDLVQLRGLARRANSSGTVIAYLPAGHTPTANIHFTSVGDPGYIRIVIDLNGAVYPTASSADGWTSLNGIQFVVP